MIEAARMVRMAPQPGLPKVEIEEAILNPKFRYRVEVNPQRLGFLLFSSGIPAESVDRYTLAIKTSDPEDEQSAPGNDLYVKGDYDPPTKTMSLFVERFLDKYYVAKDEAQLIMSGAGHVLTRPPFEAFLTTKRLPNYLHNVPQERGEAFVEKLLGITLKREFEDMLVHESNHAAAITRIYDNFLFGFSKRLALELHSLRDLVKPMGRLEKFLKHPFERMGRRAAKDRGLNDAAEGIVVFQFNRQA